MNDVRNESGQSSGYALLVVSAGVRYWEDATVNGVEDEQGGLIPFRNSDKWEPVIELATGLIRDWPQGTVADVHYKVCDAGEYWLADADGNKVAKWSGYYVPDKLLCVGANGYGDYIILTVGSDGKIKGWNPPKIDVDEWEHQASDNHVAAALFAVRVLTCQGRIEYADADLVPHLREISDRYEELKGVNDFTTAGLTAKSEWLARHMTANDAEARTFAPRASTGDIEAGADCRAAVCSALAELEKATAKFPTWPTDPLHALSVLGEEFGELTKEMVQMTYEPHKTTRETVRTEAIQTAAMALRLVMSLDRYDYTPREQHSQQNADVCGERSGP